MSQKRTHRYPGVQPFQKEQAHLFFGRDEDTERLFDLILLEKLVVLFGKSGYGKSSLLNAGILPLLDKETQKGKRAYFPVRIRFNAWIENGETLLDKLFLHYLIALEPFIGRHLQVLGVDERISDTLWSILKFSRLGSETTILLIFDQFEEFFTYPEAQQQEFKRQLAELLYADVPTYVKQNEDKHTPEEIAFLSEKMDVKTIFSIRADRMSDLDRLKDKLPAILHKRCELRALSTTQAREALVEPARKAGDFLSPAFDWTDSALARILDEFSHDNQGRSVGVEAFLLQVLAQNVESQVIRGDIADRDGDGTPDVSPEDLPDDLSNIFAEYYRNKIGDLPIEQQLPAQMIIEKGLIFSGPDGVSRRLSIDAEVLMLQFSVEEKLLKDLEDTFIIRREISTVGKHSYEISHDTLVEPILNARKEREFESRIKRENLLKLASLERRDSRNFRFPGVRPFIKEEHDLFYGRNRETEELFNLVSTEKLVILFSKSGHGKTSLLNAGLLYQFELKNKIESNKYIFLTIRFFVWNEYSDDDLVSILYSKIDEAFVSEGFLVPRDSSFHNDNLDSFHERWLLIDTETIFVIIFDQFEELFTYPEKIQLNFARALSTVIYKSNIQYRAILAIRSDRLHLLDKLSGELPSILHKRYQLDAFNREMAIEALKLPARLTGDYISPPFEFSVEALNWIIDFLSGESSQVEPIQLQIYAQHLETKSINEGIQYFEYNDVKNLGSVFEKFYMDKISLIPEPEEQNKARILCEDGLISDLLHYPRRLSLNEDVIITFFGVSINSLKILCDNSLLRVNLDIHGQNTYELSHDSLLNPLLESRKRRKAEENQLREIEESRLRTEALEMEAAEERLRLEEALRLQRLSEQAKRRAQKTTIVAIGMAFLACLGLLGAGWLYDQSEKDKERAITSEKTAQEEKNRALAAEKTAEREKDKAFQAETLARESEKRAINALETARQEQRQKFRTEAEAARKEKRYTEALRAYQEVLKLAANPAEAQTLRKQISETEREKNNYEFQRNKDIGLAMKEAGDCKGALVYLKKAAESHNDLAVKTAITECINAKN